MMNYMKNKVRDSKLLPALLLGTIPFISACSDDDDNAVASDVATQTIAEITGEVDRFSILNQAVATAGLGDTLSGDGPFTVFAPNNDADPNDTLSTPADILALPNLADILLYHVVPESVQASDALTIAASDMNMADTALANNSISLSISTENGEIVLYINTSAVIATDILASNGIIHEVNKVLLPPERNEDNIANTIVDVVGSDPDLSSLNAAIAASSLDATPLTQAGSFTVFAPTNAAFDALIAATDGVNTLGELVAALGADGLADVISQHIVPGLEIESLVAFAANGSAVPTLLSGKSLPVTIEGGLLKVGGSTVTVTDIITSNGVVHKIDTVITTGSVDTP